MKTIKTVGTGELTLKPDVVRLYMTVTGVAGDYEETVRMSEERSATAFRRSALRETTSRPSVSM